MASQYVFIITAFVIIGLIISPSLTGITATHHEILSPKKQMALGVSAEDVKCKSGLVLMIRSSGTAACVKSETSMKLSAVGWGNIIEKSMDEMKEEDHMEDENHEKEITFEEALSMGEQDPMDENANHTKIELEEDVSAGEDDSMPDESSEEIFSIGGIDLSMAIFVEGNVDAPITIIEFGDYQCPKCKQWFQQEKPAVTSDHILTGVANLYFVDTTWLGDDSITAAQATYCADDQGKFKQYHATLYNNQGGIEDGWASSDSLKQIAIDLGLDSEMFDECLDSGKYADRVSYNNEVSISNGVEVTPHFILVGPDGTIKTITGPQPAVVFDAAINSLGY